MPSFEDMIPDDQNRFNGGHSNITGKMDHQPQPHACDTSYTNGDQHENRNSSSPIEGGDIMLIDVFTRWTS